jgi:hypothetical protein
MLLLPRQIEAVQVNGQVIAQAAVYAEITRLENEAVFRGESLSPQLCKAIRADAVERLIDRILMLQEAERLGLIPDEMQIKSAMAEVAPRFDGGAGCRAGVDIPELYSEVRNRLMIERLLARWCRRMHAPRLNELREFYRQNRDQFWTPELVGVAHIVKNVPLAEDAEAVRRELVRIRQLLISGADFTETARLYSDCRDNGGDLGYFPRGHMVEEFDEVVFSVPAGTLTEVFQSRFGFHIALVYDRKPEGTRKFEELKPQIEAAVLRRKQECEVGSRLALLRKQARIRRPSPS